mmetsp:Transcript_12607/g.30766  ORF Transcript_12607/g.30766 Transcript_12607/m.30766 type:complete len:568 (-) Transcript_12607:185-1888(-)
MTMGDGEDKEPPIILEGIGWKRRSGFGKFSTTVGIGSSWERRRFVLTSKKLSYYAVSEFSKEDSPRGSTDILSERATLTAAYAGDLSQPTPYAVVIKTTDLLSQSEGTKWRLCFDDRETQLMWIVAFTGIVSDASVKEYNAKVLSAELDKSAHGGFHRMYEEEDGRLLDLVHHALLSSTKRKKRISSLENIHEESIEVFKSTHNIHIMDDEEFTESTTTTSPGGQAPHPPANFNDDKKQEDKLPMEKLYQALIVVMLSLVYDKCAKKSSSLLWQLVNVVILCICFAPAKMKKVNKKGKSKVAANESDVKRAKEASPVTEMASAKSSENVTMSMVGAALMKAEGVPLSDVPFENFPAEKRKLGDKDQEKHRLEPLTEDEMGAHTNERWAMSAPDVDLSGEWTLIANDDFKQEYDAYLKQLGFGGIVRKVACNVISRTTEITKQSSHGRELYLKGTNPKGAWERTLTASGYPDFETHPERKEGEDYSHVKTSIKTADSEDVDAEAWWEDRGTKHRSWLRGSKKYGGGDFESLRYLQEGSGGTVLVCESFFHSIDASKKKAIVTWRFQRD